MKPQTKPAIPAPLDPAFDPAVLFNRGYARALRASGKAVPLVIGLEREHALVSRYETRVSPDADAGTLRYVERLVKFLLWARGGWKLYIGGPPVVGNFVRKTFSNRGARKFDCGLMSAAYREKFQVVVTTTENVPATRELEVSTGAGFKGCRIGFDLGASDYKVAAVIDGDSVFTEETSWDPKNQADPAYHYHHISSALHRAAAHLPRVDAIGGSSAGIIVDNEIRVASLLRAVPKKHFPQAAGIFKRIQKEWNVPLVVMNDGDVTALAGAVTLRRKGMLGIALGSSQAAGFMDRQGRIHGWLNELAFTPVDYSSNAVADEWSGDRGVGVMYFSQQAVNKLLPAADIKLPRQMDLPERLIEVQTLMHKGDSRAAKIYETIGVYLGYSLAHYADFYDFNNALILGRVTTGHGGEIILGKAREVLRKEFQDLSKIRLHVPDEKSRRLGQAVAAASLPSVGNTLASPRTSSLPLRERTGRSSVAILH
jgi:predicted NBD/HSP70 family sugar kinase